jgi:hypothetical protein
MQLLANESDSDKPAGSIGGEVSRRGPLNPGVSLTAGFDALSRVSR